MGGPHFSEQVQPFSMLPSFLTAWSLPSMHTASLRHDAGKVAGIHSILETVAAQLLMSTCWPRLWSHCQGRLESYVSKRPISTTLLQA